MGILRTLRIVARDLRLGPRSPVFLFALVMPPLLTFLIAKTPAGAMSSGCILFLISCLFIAELSELPGCRACRDSVIPTPGQRR